ncbi:MAG TPA: site-2 protease family protein [Ilumatobacter sp.]|nr:site-2 protease family protein [Ilumatobacter sp.]
MTTDQQLPPPPVPEAPARRTGRLTSEVMAGGSVVEKADDELVGGVRGLVGVIGVVALIGVLGLFNLWWLVFVVGVLISIFMHELGHYMTARWTGMKATQFFIGFGPRLWSFRKGETEYGVRALPLGAFVRIIGMNNMDEVPPEDESRTYRSKSYPRRMLVISAGSLMHMLIAIVLLFTVYVADGEITPTDGVEVRQVLVASPAATAGLRSDDVIVAIDGERLEEPEDLGTVVQASRAGDTLDVVVLRDGARVAVPVVIAANADRSSPLYGKPYIGVSSSRAFETIDHSVPAAAVNAVIDIVPTSWEMTKGVVKVLNPVNIATHLAGTNEDLETRPTTLVGVTSVSDDVGDSAGFIGILFLLAILNVFVGVFNMFPLLPLDGGHAAIATYERLRERNGQRYHADVSKMMPFAMAVITMLMFLFMAGLYLDITQPVG